MSAIDTIVYFGRLKGMDSTDARRRGMDLLTRFDLADRAKSDIGDMSKGMAQKVQLATSLVNDPELWQRMSDNARAYVGHTFSFETGRSLMRTAFETVDLYSPEI